MREPAASKRRPVLYCIVPEDLAERAHEPLRRHFADDPGVEVIVEQRWRDRRKGADRRSAEGAPDALAEERRRIRAAYGRRVADRRSPVVGVGAPRPLPGGLDDVAERLVFVEVLEPSSDQLEDRDTARLVARLQAGERDVFGTLYMRYFDRVYAYLRVLYKEDHEAEDATQQVFIRVFENIERYERRSQPFRAWLFTIVRNTAVSDLRRYGRIAPVEPAIVERDRDEAIEDDAAEQPLRWLTDRDLLMFIERLPLAQRQVLMLRYMLDLSTGEIAQVLERSPEDIRQLHSRALSFLRTRLAAVRRSAERGEPMAMRGIAGPQTVLRSRRYALHA